MNYAHEFIILVVLEKERTCESLFSAISLSPIPTFPLCLLFLLLYLYGPYYTHILFVILNNHHHQFFVFPDKAKENLFIHSDLSAPKLETGREKLSRNW